MTTTQDFTQVEQLATFSGYPLSAPSAFAATTPAPESTEDVREPLRELSEQSTNEEQNTEKLGEYVSKVLEKILQQKSNVAKIDSVLDNTNESASTDESSEEDSDDSLKENFSPVSSKMSSKLEFAVASPERALASSPSQKVAPKFKLEDVLEITKKTINFGTRFPGQIVEEQLDIVNKSKYDFVVQIYVNCLNEELDNSDEYVFSVRRTHLYDYNDKHYLIMAPYSSASFKFALKVPNMKIVGGIQGEVKVGIQGQEDFHHIDLLGSVTIPKVFCPKELTCRGLDYKVIKLAVKEGKKQELKIPLRNNGDVPVTLELEFYEPENNQKKDKFDVMVHPNVITINPNSQAIANILVKPHRGATGLKQQPGRKILTARVRDSALVYSFVFWIEFY